MLLGDNSHTTYDMNKRYNNIDLFKLLMAVFVIAAHTIEIDVLIGNTFVCQFYNSVIGCAVPFFFISMGFFIEQSIECDDSGLKEVQIIARNIFKLVKKYVTLSLLYLPLAVAHYIDQGTPLRRIISFYVRDFFYVGDHYNSWPLWFLLSSVYALLFIVILRTILSFDTSQIMFCGAMLFIISLCIDWMVAQDAVDPFLVPVKQTIVDTIRKGRLFRGFFFIPTGMFIMQRKPQYRVVFPACLCVLSLFGASLINHIVLNGIVSAVLYVSLFLVILKIELPDHDIYLTLRKMSVFFYESHMWVWTIVYMIFYREKTYGMIPFSMTVVICTSLFFVYNKMKTRMVNC